MGVDRSDYIIVGYKLPYDLKDKNGQKLSDLVWDDEFTPLTEGWQNEPFRVVVDGMTGNYIAFGKEILNADEPDGFDFQEISIDDISFTEVSNRANELFVNFDYDFSKPKILIFSHYS